MTKYLDITNQTFGKLTAIEPFNIDRKRLWRFNCQCGSVVEYRASVVASGHVKSCGCIAKQKYVGEKSLAYDLFTRNYAEGDLSFDKFYELIFQNCYYCNTAPSNTYNRKNFKTKKIKYTLVYNGIDRLDSNLPHNLDNVVTCCWQCNKLKSNTHVNDFLKHIKAIYKNRVAD